MNIIFLDIDGVLNNDETLETINGACGVGDNLVQRLERIVRKTNAKIILTSSWRFDWWKDNKLEQDEFANYLDEKLAKYNLHIDDKIDYDDEYTRGEGIINYLGSLKEDVRFVIIDDESFDYEEQGLLLYFVQTLPRIGLSDKNVIDAINILNRG